MRSRPWMPPGPLGVLVVCLSLTACSSFFSPFDASPASGGSDTPHPPAVTPSTSVPQPTHTPPPPPPKEVFGWGLPDGPSTPDGTYEDDFYALLEEGRCDVMAEALLGRRDLDGLNGPISWYSLESPRTVLLYYVAANLCMGRSDEARRVDGWAAKYGTRGIKWDQNEDPAPPEFFWDCEVFKSVRSVLDQVDRATVTCPGGVPLRWPNPDAKDNPLTSKVESVNRFGEPATPSVSPSASPDPSADPTPSAGG